MRVELVGLPSVVTLVPIQQYPEGVVHVGNCKPDDLVKIVYLETIHRRGATPNTEVIGVGAKIWKASELADQRGLYQLCYVVRRCVECGEEV